MNAVLVGGPGDGKLVDTREPYVRMVVSSDPYSVSHKEILYRAEKAVSPYPIPGWDLLLIEDITRGTEGVGAWWTTKVWALPERHAEIAAHFEDALNPALAEVFWHRDMHRSDPAANERLEAAIARLVALTTPAEVRS